MEKTTSSCNSNIKFGVDIGGTDTKFIIIEDGKILYKTKIATNKTNADALVESISEVVEEIKKKYDICAIGVGTPGTVVDGVVVRAGRLPFSNFPLASELEKKTGLPVRIENDANCAALGEVYFGGNDYNDLVTVTLGTGIGSGIIINKKIHNSGEIGHSVIVAKDGIDCQCGRSGCWEQYASVTALIRDASKAALENKSSILYKLYEEHGALNGKLIFDAMDMGCETAKAVFEEYLKYLAVGIKNIINILVPDAVVLSGGITARGNMITDNLGKYIDSDIPTPIIISKLQNDAGAMGAAMLI